MQSNDNQQTRQSKSKLQQEHFSAVQAAYFILYLLGGKCKTQY